MRRFLGTWVAGCIALCACTGCDHEATSYQCRPVDVDGWEQFDTLMFVVDSLPNDGLYALNVGLRTTNAFPYQTLFLEVKQKWEQPAAYRCDTLKCTLAAPNGDIKGSGISHFQYVFPLGSHSLSAGQHGDIIIRHLMRRELLPGIASVGIELTQAD